MLAHKSRLQIEAELSISRRVAIARCKTATGTRRPNRGGGQWTAGGCVGGGAGAVEPLYPLYRAFG